MLDSPHSDQPRTKVPWAVPIKKCEEPEEPPKLDLEGDPEEADGELPEQDGPAPTEAEEAQEAHEAACLDADEDPFEDSDELLEIEKALNDYDDLDEDPEDAEPVLEDEVAEAEDEDASDELLEIEKALNDYDDLDEDAEDVEPVLEDEAVESEDEEAPDELSEIEKALNDYEDLDEDPEDAEPVEEDSAAEPEEAEVPAELSGDTVEEAPEPLDQDLAEADDADGAAESKPEPVSEQAEELPVEDLVDLVDHAAAEADDALSQAGADQPEADEPLCEPDAPCAATEQADAPAEEQAVNQDAVEPFSADELTTWEEQEIEASVADALAYAAPATVEALTPQDVFADDPEPEPVIEDDTEETLALCDDAVVRSLMDMLITPTGMIQPQEQAFAADLLLQVVDHASTNAKHMMCDRLANMQEAPPALISRFLNEEPLEISSPLLLRGSSVPASVLISVVEAGEQERCSMIARREHLLPVVSTALAKSPDDAIILDLVRNNCAQLSQEALELLTLRAFECEDLIEPLVNRTEMTAACALFLFWAMPAKERTYVIGRFLADVQVLSQVLVMSEGGGDALSSALETGRGNGIQLVLADKPSKRKGSEFAAVVETADLASIARTIASFGDIAPDAAEKIAQDQGGEPLTVACKALGLSRLAFASALEQWNAAQDPGVDVDALKILFDTLSFRQARMALMYWDWQARCIGPYAKFPHKYTGGAA